MIINPYYFVNIAKNMRRGDIIILLSWRFWKNAKLLEPFKDKLINCNIGGAWPEEVLSMRRNM